MTSAQGAYGTLSWTYDAVGNRLSQQKTSGTTTNHTYTYAATSNRLQSVTDGGTARGFTYTPVGNVSLDDRGVAADLTFTSNAANRLAAIAAASGTVATMVYDGLGRRITRQEGSATARYHYDADDRLIAISDGSGNWTETIWLEDLPVAQATGSNLVAIHTDQIGQPARMTNSSGAIVWSRTAQPFGETYAESGAIATVLRFPGQVADAATQTHYNMARDYDPSLGRYLQSDPIGLDGAIQRNAWRPSVALPLLSRICSVGRRETHRFHLQSRVVFHVIPAMTAKRDGQSLQNKWSGASCCRHWRCIVCRCSVQRFSLYGPEVIRVIGQVATNGHLFCPHFLEF